MVLAADVTAVPAGTIRDVLAAAAVGIAAFTGDPLS